MGKLGGSGRRGNHIQNILYKIYFSIEMYGKYNLRPSDGTSLSLSLRRVLSHKCDVDTEAG